MLIFKHFHFISDNPLSRFPAKAGQYPQRGAERFKIARWAILAKEPACREAIAQPGPSLKLAKGLISLRSATPVGEGWDGGNYYLKFYCFIHDCRLVVMR
jgi:hypothetical protein